MQHKIEFPVGEWRRGAVNRKADVKEVQTLLKQAASNTNRSVYDPGKIDGLVAKPPRRSGTIKAITAFQKRFMRHPDGVVEPGKKTFNQLLKIAKVKPAAPTPAPAPSRSVSKGPTPKQLEFTSGTIGLVVRGKRNAGHEPGVRHLAQIKLSAAVSPRVRSRLTSSEKSSKYIEYSCGFSCGRARERSPWTRRVLATLFVLGT